MDLRQLRHLVALAETRSFTRAAERLGMSQPALSQSISRLERELGCTLLHRNKQNPGAGIVLTLAGESLYADGLEVLTAADRAESRARRAGGAHGVLRVAIGFSPGTPREFLTAALAAPPGEEVVAVQLEWGSEHEAVLQGAADVAFLQYPVGAELPGFELRGLARFPLVALLPAGHRLAGRERVELGELAGEPVLDPGFSDGPAGFRELWLGLPRPASAPLGPVVGPANRTIEEMYAFVAAGRAMAITSAAVPVQHQRDDLAIAEIVGLPGVEVGIARLAEDRRAAVLAVVERLERELGAR